MDRSFKKKSNPNYPFISRKPIKVSDSYKKPQKLNIVDGFGFKIFRSQKDYAIFKIKRTNQT